MSKYAKITVVLLLTLAVFLVPAMTSCSAPSNSGGGISYSPPYNDISEKNYPDSGLSVGETPVILDDIPDPSLNAGEYARKIIRTCTITGETKEFDSALSALQTMVAACGGYVGESSTTGNSYSTAYGTYSRRATLTLRIPAGNLDSFIADVEGLVNVTASSTKAQDVSESYYDLEARTETLEAERDSLLAMMASLNNATQYDFWYQLQVRVSEIEQTIAANRATLKNYDNRVSYSTVAITLAEVIEYTPTAPEEPTFGERIMKAFTGSWSDFADGCMSFSVFIVSAIPTLLVIAAIITGIVLIIRGMIRRSRKKKAAAAAARQTQG